jgi:hypothetical protein
MAKNSNPEAHAFFQKYAVQLDDCLKLRIISSKGVTSCRELVKAARSELGYSVTTSAVDIISPLRRGYKVWKANQLRKI